MSTLIQSYEQQYSVLTAEITSKIGRLKLGNDDDPDKLSREIQSSFEEANDLLEQLELECRGSGVGSRVGAYRAELQRVREEFRSVISNAAAYNIDPDEYEDWSAVNEQRQKLLENTERLDRSGKRLTEGYRIILETEQIGNAVLQDLHHQRETLQRTRARLRETDADLNRSTRLVKAMMTRAVQHKIILASVLGLLSILGVLGIYFYVT